MTTTGMQVPPSGSPDMSISRQFKLGVLFALENHSLHVPTGWQASPSQKLLLAPFLGLGRAYLWSSVLLECFKTFLQKPS